MKTLDIAVNASRVWHILEGTYSITTNQVKKLLSLSDKDFFAAIGWLACEHHIYCDEQDGEWYVSNKQPLGFFSFKNKKEARGKFQTRK